ncbi:MAG: hypothetical protein JSC161_000706 [Candidatus Tokpelaia sp. JSC161]|jgi:ribosomal subunit interface protein|nr:MAG: hypothetical protein JSC161_000706 [Candidatus Tokpelaia sp. JSC161]
MTLRISGKHMDIGDAFRTCIEERIRDTTLKYFNGTYSGHVTVVKSGSRYSADCLLRLSTGTILQTTGEAQNPRMAFDTAAERIETRLRRYKRRRKSHQNISIEKVFHNLTHHIIEALPNINENLPENYAPTIVAETPITLPSLSVAAAVLELDLIDNPILVFRNAANEKINIVYRRTDGNIGWVDPLAVKQEI